MFLFKSNTHGQLGSIIGVIEFAKSISFCNNLAPLWFSRGLIAPITDKSWTKILIFYEFSNSAEKTGGLTLNEFNLIQMESAGNVLMPSIRFTQTLPQKRQIKWSKILFSKFSTRTGENADELRLHVTNILQLSPTHFVSIIRHRHRCNR